MIFSSPLFTIALRQLSNKKRQTILTISGISVGVMVLITAISLMDGLLQSFTQKIVDSTPHIVVSSDRIRPLTPDIIMDSTKGVFLNLSKHVERDDNDVITNYSGVISNIMSDTRISFVSPVVLIDEVGTFGTMTTPLKITGILPSIENNIERFSENMTEGVFEDLERSPDGFMIGASAAKDFLVHTGDRIQLSTATGELISVRVTGIFNTGLNEADNMCYVNLRMAQILGGFKSGQVSKLFVRVNDLKANTSIARAIEGKTNYKSITWEESAQGFLSLFKMITSIVYFLTFFVILVSGFSVANVLITNVLEKTRDIAIMKSMGYRKDEITMIYLVQGLFVAVLGAFVGSILGLGMIEILSSIPTEGSKSGVVRSDHLEMGRSIWYFISASGFAILISLLASVGPARNAAKVNPVEILRGER